MKETYNGFDIYFDRNTEEWYTLIDQDGKPWIVGGVGQDRVIDSSLKKLKEKLDVLRRSKFQRRVVFVRVGRYRHGGGEDKEYFPQYTEATLTSVAPNGNAYYVVKGSKHAEKENLRWGSKIVIDTPANRKLIEEIEAAGRKEWEAEVVQKKASAKLTTYNEDLYEEIYGKKIIR